MRITLGARHLATRLLALIGATLHAGCSQSLRFPDPIVQSVGDQQAVRAYDTDGDHELDYWQYQDDAGRTVALAYADWALGRPGERVTLDGQAPADCPHFIIALDGVPYEIVAQMYAEGHFRLFHPPRRVICCFPAMTDLALADMFHTLPCLAYQATYFDRAANRMSSGNAVYLAAKNSPWLAKMDYRCSFWWDAKAYLEPQAVFHHELAGIAETFSRIDHGQAAAYSVGSAGLGTRRGAAGMRAYLEQVDELCERIVHERRGRVKITLTADHGHNLVVNQRIGFEEQLENCGYREAKSLNHPGDVVVIGYGLVTYAAFCTDDPAGVAACVARHDAVEFACYPAGDAVVVQNQQGRALIRRGDHGFVYDAESADPLELTPILDELRAAGHVSDAGEIDPDALFAATVMHVYPDPLRRIWEAFHELVEHPPDVLANLRDGTCHGSRFFEFMIGEVTSTHGSLNRRNSTTFVLTMVGELPDALRARDLLPAIEKFFE